MFALFNKAIPIPSASHFVVTIPADDGDKEYRALAEKIGALHLLGESDQQRRWDRFESFLASLGIQSYKQEEVKQYLDAQYGKIPWGFRALRAQDNPNFALGNFIAADGTWNNGGYRPDHSFTGRFIGGKDPRLYSKPVPYPALLTIDRISKEFPKATFWISDEMTRQPVFKDPFLLVRFEERSHIIERWDEPQFRTKEK